MKIGILEAGAVPTHLGDRFGRYGDMMARLLGPDFETEAFRVRDGDFPASPDACDGWLVTGSSSGVYDDLPWIPRLVAFLREAKGLVPIVGICFGHQVMAEAFGGRVIKSEKGFGIGLHSYDVADSLPWMDKAARIRVPVSHQDQVVGQPPHSRVIASSSFTPYAALAYEDQPAISFQCHPEFEPAFAAELCHLRRGKVADEAVETALFSLEGENDSAQVAGWIRAFLRDAIAARRGAAAAAAAA